MSCEDIAPLNVFSAVEIEVFILPAWGSIPGMEPSMKTVQFPRRTDFTRNLGLMIFNTHTAGFPAIQCLQYFNVLVITLPALLGDEL